jgi:plastocyanin
MKILSGVTATALVAAALMFGSTTSFSQDACDRGGNHTIQVSAGADGKPVLSYKGGSAENVYVCRGDQVQWVLTGSDRSFFVDFFSGAPFGGAQKRGSSNGAVSVTIGDNTGSYDYGVEFEGGEPMDPRIIVE